MNEKLRILLTVFGFNVENVSICQVKREEDDTYYEVWRIYSDKGVYIIKECKEFESDIYNTILKEGEYCVPKYFSTAVYEGKDFILLENLEGDNLNNCTKEKLISFLDSLIFLRINTGIIKRLTTSAITYRIV